MVAKSLSHKSSKRDDSPQVSHVFKNQKSRSQKCIHGLKINIRLALHMRQQILED